MMELCLLKMLTQHILGQECRGQVGAVHKPDQDSSPRIQAASYYMAGVLYVGAISAGLLFDESFTYPSKVTHDTLLVSVYLNTDPVYYKWNGAHAKIHVNTDITLGNHFRSCVVSERIQASRTLWTGFWLCWRNWLVQNMWQGREKPNINVDFTWFYGLPHVNDPFNFFPYQNDLLHYFDICNL